MLFRANESMGLAGARSGQSGVRGPNFRWTMRLVVDRVV